MPAISLDWFAAQQQTGALRQQKLGWLYIKFIVESTEFSIFF